MAITQNVLIGKTRGSVGNATFTKWKGKNVLKSKAQNSYSNPTSTQLRNNSRFGVIVAFARLIRSLYLIGFSEVATTMSEYNKFISLNNPEAFSNSAGQELQLVPSQMILAQGTGANITSVPTVEAAGGGDIDIELLQSAENKSNADSTLYGLVFVGDTPVIRGSDSTAIQPNASGTSTGTINIAGAVGGDTLILFIKDSVTGNISDSVAVTITAA